MERRLDYTECQMWRLWHGGSWKWTIIQRGPQMLSMHYFKKQKVKLFELNLIKSSLQPLFLCVARGCGIRIWKKAGGVVFLLFRNQQNRNSVLRWSNISIRQSTCTSVYNEFGADGAKLSPGLCCKMLRTNLKVKCSASADDSGVMVYDEAALIVPSDDGVDERWTTAGNDGCHIRPSSRILQYLRENVIVGGSEMGRTMSLKCSN